MTVGPARLASALLLVGLAGCAGPTPRLADLPIQSLEGCPPFEAAPSLAQLDLAIAINDASSTSRPSGSDIDGDGVVGAFRQSRSTDPGDSLLAAQVAAVWTLVKNGSLGGTRVSILGYAGRMEAEDRYVPMSFVSHDEVLSAAPLTSDPAVLEEGLGAVLARGSRGAIDFTAALVQALRMLRAAEPGEGPRPRAIVLMSHRVTPLLGAPTLLAHRTSLGEDANGASVVRHDPYLATAVRQVMRHGATIHTIALGEAADEPPPHPLSRIATATGGSFWVVRDASTLPCALLGAAVEGTVSDPR